MQVCCGFLAYPGSQLVNLEFKRYEMNCFGSFVAGSKEEDSVIFVESCGLFDEFVFPVLA